MYFDRLLALHKPRARSMVQSQTGKCFALFWHMWWFFSCSSSFNSTLRHFLTQTFKTGLTHLEPSPWWLEIIYHIRADTPFINIYSLWWHWQMGWAVWAEARGAASPCLALLEKRAWNQPLPGLAGGTARALLPLDQLHQDTWNWDTQDLVNQLLSSLPVMRFEVFKLSQQQLCALGSSWCPPQIHTLGHLLDFISWSHKGQIKIPLW